MNSKPDCRVDNNNKSFSAIKMKTYLCPVMCSLLALNGLGADYVFTTFAKQNSSLVTGRLGNVDLVINGGEFSSSVFNEADYFGASFFQPSIPKSQSLDFRSPKIGPAEYEITFSVPILNPIIHFKSLASTLIFHDLMPRRLSGGDYFAVSGSTVTGRFKDSPVLGEDSNGSVQFQGLIERISFSTQYQYSGDSEGISMQIVQTISHEEPVLMIEPNGKIKFQSQNTLTYGLLSGATMDVSSWLPTGEVIEGDGSIKVIDAGLADAMRFYRLWILPEEAPFDFSVAFSDSRP